MKHSDLHQVLIMIGTHPNAKGGVATVVTKYRAFGLFEKWRVKYLFTHTDGPIYKKLKVALFAYWRMVHFLARGNVGLVHIHIASRASTWRKSIFALTAFLFQVPYVLHLHGAEFMKFFHKECGPLRRLIIRVLLKKAASVIALSESWADHLREMAPGTRVDVIYNSVSLPKRPKRYESSEGTQDILFLGHIGKRKGTFDLIRAFALVGGDVRLALGGEGDIDHATKLAQQLGMPGRVRLLGWVAGADKDIILSKASVFVLPSYSEGLPMSVLEAMAWGIPVVTTPVGGIPEVIRQGEEGFLVQPGDIEGLTAALRLLLGNRLLRQRLGTNGRERVRNIFSHSVVFPKLEAIWARFGLLPSSITKTTD